jgi:diguanylate cyclase (GGDEF)-like protein
MTFKKTDMNFFNRYLDKKERFYEKKNISTIKIIICVILYASLIFFQKKIQSSDSILGVLAQVQVLISVFLVVSTSKNGYVTALFLNIIQSFIVTFQVLVYGKIGTTPGIFVPLCTIVSVSIIYIYSRRLNNKFIEINMQKEELITLYEELAATEDELCQQNKQLLEYNKSMKENEEKLNHLAYFDVLTELPNRKMIIDRLDFLISLSIKQEMKFAMAFIDLDNFKRVNDSLGHQAGDLLLQEVAKRLKIVIHPDDMLGRLGGDEFALIIQRELKEEEILVYIENLRHILLDKFYISNTELIISASFGISIYPQDGENSIDLLKCSDTAMYKAKDDGKNGIQFFNKEMKDNIFKRIEFEKRLLSTIQNNELFIVFQPQYSSDCKKLRGFEALVRWQSPELGLVSPAQFIPVSEETKFIIPMGKWILKTVCEKFKELFNKYNFTSIISVNISAVQIMEPSFNDTVKDILEETGFDAKYLEFEITESVFISSMDYVIGVLNQLKKLGIRIALDDFGTGYSSLSYLQMLPIDTLKIDKIFIDRIISPEIGKQIVGPIISLVHQMDISVVAEGVENYTQLNYLKSQFCDCIQGYLWGKPLGEDDLNELLRELTSGEFKIGGTE